MCHSPIPSITMNDSDLHTVDHSKLVRICPSDSLQPCRWSHRPAKSAPNHITHKAPLTCIKCAQIMQPSPSNIVGFKSASLIGKINKNINKQKSHKKTPTTPHSHTTLLKLPSQHKKANMQVQSDAKKRKNSIGSPHSDACDVPIDKRNLIRYNRFDSRWCSIRHRILVFVYEPL